MPKTNQEPRSERIDVRTSTSVKRLLQRATHAANKTVSEFMLDSALTAANETLADRRMFLLDEEHWRAFIEALDQPPRPRPRMERLLREPSVFE